VSTALGIAATTRVITAVIDDHIGNANLTGILGAAHTSSTPPDRIQTDPPEHTGLNLFLYHVTFNSGWREVKLPSRNGSGDVIDRPPLAIDLHYMLTAYGEDDYTPQILLGLGMQALHESPLLDRQKIRNVFTPPPPLNDIDKALATADVADQVELIKISPEPMGTDDLGKLWTAFGNHFRPSAAYVASVVLLESTVPVRSALPVLARNIAVIQFREPFVADVQPRFLLWSPAPQIVMTGENLTGPGVVVLFDQNPAAPQTPNALDLAGGRVSVSVPPLPAGMNTLRAVRQLAIGAPPIRNIVESNVGLLFLQPVIRRDLNVPHDDLITVGSPDTSVSPPTTAVTVTLDPALASTQHVSLLLNELDPPPAQAPLSYVFDALPSQIAPNSVTFTTFGTRPGLHLVRVRVDGAESPLRTDPTSQTFTAPKVLLA
jgi:hypothetical protein